MDRVIRRYYLRIVGPYYVRVPRWLYNKWPTGGLVEFYDEPTIHSKKAEDCPACHRDNVRYPFGEDTWKCRQCGAIQAADGRMFQRPGYPGYREYLREWKTARGL